MPRERVHHGDLYMQGEQKESTPERPAGIWRLKYDPVVPQPPDTIIIQEPSLDVNWDRSGWVQVSIEMEARQWHQNSRELKELEAENGAFTHTRAIYTDILTRTEINKMIKILRRARDAAYGVDE